MAENCCQSQNIDKKPLRKSVVNQDHTVQELKKECHRNTSNRNSWGWVWRVGRGDLEFLLLAFVRRSFLYSGTVRSRSTALTEEGGSFRQETVWVD